MDVQRTAAWSIPTAVVALIALIVSLNVASRPTHSAGAAQNALAVTLSELKITPAAMTAEVGHPISIEVHNAGAVQHNLVLPGQGRTAMLDPGSSATLTLPALAAGTYTLICEVAGHEGAGMKATLEVRGSGAGAAPAATHAMTADEMDASYMAGVKAFPAKTKALGGQLLQPLVNDGVKVFDLTASEVDWEVAPGDVKKAMAYNGVVPGPQIRVKLGDRVRVVMHNRLAESTAMHFHGLELDNAQDGVPGLTQDLVKPGADHTHEFVVPNAGTHMYHSHMNGAKQIPMGLLGAFIVEGPNEPSSDVDVPMVLNDGALGFTLNGKSFPATQPIVAKPGQTVRIRYMNEGLQGHPMHLHGMVQTVISKDGWPLPAPYRADTVWVAPGERYDVLVTAREGLWAFHCHILSHAEAESGMFGMVTVFVSK